MNIFDFAMQMEKDGETYYRDLADKCELEGLKKILNMLADDEVVHYDTLKKLKDGVPGDFAETGVLQKAKNVFAALKESGDTIDIETSTIQLYDKAIEIEQKSEQFYMEKANEVDQPEVKKILLRIAEDEKKHQFLLKNTTDFISRPQSWVENAEFHHLDEY